MQDLNEDDIVPPCPEPSQPAQHVGLVDDRRQATWMHYRINREGTEHGATLFDLLAAMLGAFEQAAADQFRLEAHLAAKEKSSCL